MTIPAALGPELLLPPGNVLVPTSAVLERATSVALYFSAHWCGPCRGFTPLLAKVYSRLRNAGMQIIFVSSDHDEDSFYEYYATMPWKAMPFDSDRAALGTRFNVRGIPALVLLDQNYKTVTTKGTNLLRADSTGDSLLQAVRTHVPEETITYVRRPTFPASPLVDVFGPKLLRNNEFVGTAAVALNTKVFALYFSASWCGPCRKFTPLLVRAYPLFRSLGGQVIFVSSDDDEDSFFEYYSHMPWKAMPFEAARSAVGSQYGVTGIPALVLIRPDGTVITTNGTGLLRADPTGRKLMAAVQ